MGLRVLITGFLLASLAVACGGDGTGSDTVADGTVAPSSTADVTVSSTTVAATTVTTTVAVSTTTTLPMTTTSTIAGTVIQIAPSLGDVVGVVGVRHDDTLNLRAGPGIGEPVVKTAEPTFDHLVAKGQTRVLPNGSVWIEVDHTGVVGWTHLSFVAYLGGVDDATALVVAALGEYPTTTSMEGMGLLAAGVFASAEPRSRVVLTVAPTMGDLGEVTYDVIGLGDDATLGYRLHVFGQTVGDGLSLYSVERTALCNRGVTADGLCL